jgi:hypothetical protein
MAGPITYSFQDLAGAIAGTTIGAFTFNGGEQLGAGEISISMSTEKTDHKVAADGAVMVSFVAGNNGKISIQCQQNSTIDKFLLAGYNALLIAPKSQWAEVAATFRSTIMQISHAASGISFLKAADRSYKAQGDNVTWELLAADIQSIPA